MISSTNQLRIMLSDDREVSTLRGRPLNGRFGQRRARTVYVVERDDFLTRVGLGPL